MEKNQGNHDCCGVVCSLRGIGVRETSNGPAKPRHKANSSPSKNTLRIGSSSADNRLEQKVAVVAAK
jgi:hypothetical protein